MSDSVQEDRPNTAEKQGSPEPSCVDVLLTMASDLLLKIANLKGFHTIDHVASAWLQVQTFDREYGKHPTVFTQERARVVATVQRLLLFCPQEKVVGRLTEDFQCFLHGSGEK